MMKRRREREREGVNRIRERGTETEGKQGEW